jgi:hypothetical protein
LVFLNADAEIFFDYFFEKIQTRILHASDDVEFDPHKESQFYFSTFGWMSCIFLSISFLIFDSVSVVRILLRKNS